MKHGAVCCVIFLTTNDLSCSVADAEAAGYVNDAQVCKMSVAVYMLLES